MRTKSFSDLKIIASKCESQNISTTAITMQEKMKNFHNTTKNLSPAKKGKLFAKTFGKW